MTQHEVVLITGTSRGIGRSLAEHFLRRGAVVEGCSRGDAGWAAENYTHHVVDVTNEAPVRNLFSSIQKRHGRLDIAINNAGAFSMNHTLLTLATTIDQLMACNVRGTFLVCRESAKLMRQRRYGRIVNIGTVAVPMRIPGEAVYASSKSAVVTFTQIFAAEVAEFGITCNVVSPTVVGTEMLLKVPPEKLNHIVSLLPIKRPCRFEDIANVIDFFVRPESDYVTAQVINLGGV